MNLYGRGIIAYNVSDTQHIPIIKMKLKMNRWMRLHPLVTFTILVGITEYLYIL